jgi:Cytochrome c
MKALKPILYIAIASALIVGIVIVVWPEMKAKKSETDRTVPQLEGKLDPLEYDSLYVRGRNVFFANCARCHSPKLENDMTGPALYGLLERVPSREWLYSYIPNSQKVIESGDPYAVALKMKWKSVMDPMPLDRENIDCILHFIEKYDPNTNTIYIERVRPELPSGQQLK